MSTVKLSDPAPPLTLPSALSQKLILLRPLSQASLDLIAGLPLCEPQSAGQTLRPASFSGGRRGLVIVSGWAARYRLLSDGRRQIISLLLPGDHVGLSRGQAAQADLPIITLTRVEFSNATSLVAVLAAPGSAHEQLARALEDADLLTGGQMIDQMVRLGRQDGRERIAHLMSELQHRLIMCGAAQDAVFPMPLTQEMLADTLGLSIVHVNRTLQFLRRDRVLHLASGVARILKASMLAEISDYTAPRIADLQAGM